MREEKFILAHNYIHINEVVGFGKANSFYQQNEKIEKAIDLCTKSDIIKHVRNQTIN